MKLDDKAIRELLLKEEYITEADISDAEVFTKEHHASFVDYLIQKNLISKGLLGQAIAESLRVPYADLKSAAPSPRQVQTIPEEIGKKYRIVLFEWDEKKITIATDAPEQDGLPLVVAQLYPGRTTSIAYALPEDIDAALVHYQKSLETRFSAIIEKHERIAPELLEEIFEDALAYNASDIHFEPRRADVLVRFRIDGVLREAGQIPKEHYENILNRIRVQSNLRIDDHFAAQDGSLRYERNGKVVDMRTSIVPTVEGEKVVLRVLAAYVQGFSLSDIGLSLPQQALLERVAEKPFGMILVTGPTGSGKTTTLYAFLKIVNNSNVNITTIEDPVEYKTAGVNQIQVNLQTNLTFANGLRSIVRQDPDIILVGEIRDRETAEISVNAALTGHLLFSTFHANDAATAIPRLLDMGVEPFLLASTLDVVIAQRLLRKICEHCRHSTTRSIKDFKAANPVVAVPDFIDETTALYEGKGCEACNFTGYKGRTAIFEFVEITPSMKGLILRSPSTQEIWQLAHSEGSRSLFEDGIEKVKTGVTTLEELFRVAPPPSQK